MTVEMTHILLIEDDPRIRDIVEEGLGMRGLMVTSAPDGETGTELAEKLTSIDLILLDLMLPGMSGLQALRVIRKVRPTLPVIALTALDDVGSKVSGLEAGADDYVTKPFSVEELAARIRARLRWSEEGVTVLQSGSLTVDLASHRAFLDGAEIHLSAREALVAGDAHPSSRSRLVAHPAPGDGVGHRLRRRLERRGGVRRGATEKVRSRSDRNGARKRLPVRGSPEQR